MTLTPKGEARNQRLAIPLLSTAVLPRTVLFSRFGFCMPRFWCSSDSPFL